MERIRREFTVDVSRTVAWQHLGLVEQWISWAKHIKHVKLVPSGELTSTSSGVFHLKNGVRSTFKMIEYNPHDNWKWVGPFLWLTVYYDHRFEAIDGQHTNLTWTVSVEGFGEFIFGPLFAAVYNMNLNKAIRNLISEMSTLSKISQKSLTSRSPN